MCRKKNLWGRQPAWISKEILLGLRKKKRAYYFWKKGQATQEKYKGLVTLCRAEIRQAKAQAQIRLATAVSDNKNTFLHIY